ncbi:Fumitremorgin C monooxygenase [Rhypophila decipiens]
MVRHTLILLAVSLLPFTYGCDVWQDGSYALVADNQEPYFETFDTIIISATIGPFPKGFVSTATYDETIEVSTGFELSAGDPLGIISTNCLRLSHLDNIGHYRQEYFLRPSRPRFPLLNTFPNESRKARSALHQYAGKIISDGLARLNGPFWIKIPHGVKIILPHTLAGWVKANKDLDHKELVMKDFFAGFPGFEAQTVLHSEDEALKTVIRSKMSQNASTIATRSLIIARGLDRLWGNADSWHAIDWYKDTTGIIARDSSSVFVGPEKCDDPEWLDLWFLPNPTTCRKLVTRARIIMNEVTAQRQEEALKAKLEGGECSQFNDALSWTQAAGVKGEAGDIQLSLAMAGLFTTSEAFRQILVEIATHPDIVPALRKEVTEQVTAHGATISALTNMVLLDSVMKEAQRLSSPKVGITVALERIALKDVTLPDGKIIPRGSHIMVESMNLWDPAVYPKPYEFDGYRFLRRREAGDASSQFVQSSADYHVFGGGRHIWPGRFFANNILKLALSHILLKYDIRLQDGCAADVLPMGFYTMVNPMVKLEVQRREEVKNNVEMYLN